MLLLPTKFCAKLTMVAISDCWTVHSNHNIDTTATTTCSTSLTICTSKQHTTTTVLQPFVRDYPGEAVPEETHQNIHPGNKQWLAHLAMVVGRMLCNRPSQLCNFNLLCQVALQTSKHHFTLAWLEAWITAITQKLQICIQTKVQNTHSCSSRITLLTIRTTKYQSQSWSDQS